MSLSLLPQPPVQGIKETQGEGAVIPGGGGEGRGIGASVHSPHLSLPPPRRGGVQQKDDSGRGGADCTQQVWKTRPGRQEVGVLSPLRSHYF